MLIKMKTIKIPYYLQELYGRNTTRVSNVNYEHIKTDAELNKVSLGEAWHQRYGRIELQKKEITKRQGEITGMVKEAKEPKEKEPEQKAKEKKAPILLGKESWKRQEKQKAQGWYYSVQLQSLVRRKHIPTHDERGNLLPHLKALKKR